MEESRYIEILLRLDVRYCIIHTVFISCISVIQSVPAIFSCCNVSNSGFINEVVNCMEEVKTELLAAHSYRYLLKYCGETCVMSLFVKHIAYFMQIFDIWLWKIIEVNCMLFECKK
jgi:hypothetical protein